MPQCRHEEIILKMNEVGKVQKDLEAMRLPKYSKNMKFLLFLCRMKYESKFQDFEKRYKIIELGQTNLKQKLVEFNNFIKEKQEKVQVGKLKIRQERKIQIEKQAKLTCLVGQREVFDKSLQLLKKSIENKMVYVKYLEEVVNKNPELFGNINELLNKNSALIDMKNNLQTFLSRQRKEAEDTDKSLAKFKENKMKETLVFNIKLGSIVVP